MTAATMYEGKNIHFSPVDSKPLCSCSTKICKQRRLNGYAFCVRHILEDPSAPFKPCTYSPKNGKQKHKCSNSVPKDEVRSFCNFHMQLLGLAEKSSKNRNKNKVKDSHIIREAKIRDILSLEERIKTKFSVQRRPENGPGSGSDNPDDPYAFHDAPGEAQKTSELLTVCSNVNLDTHVASSVTNYHFPQYNEVSSSTDLANSESSQLVQTVSSIANKYPELTEKLERVRMKPDGKPKSGIDMKLIRNNRSSRTMSKLQNKIAQKKIKDKLKKNHSSPDSPLSISSQSSCNNAPSPQSNIGPLLSALQKELALNSKPLFGEGGIFPLKDEEDPVTPSMPTQNEALNHQLLGMSVPNIAREAPPPNVTITTKSMIPVMSTFQKSQVMFPGRNNTGSKPQPHPPHYLSRAMSSPGNTYPSSSMPSPPLGVLPQMGPSPVIPPKQSSPLAGAHPPPPPYPGHTTQYRQQNHPNNSQQVKPPQSQMSGLASSHTSLPATQVQNAGAAAAARAAIVHASSAASTRTASAAILSSLRKMSTKTHTSFSKLNHKAGEFRISPRTLASKKPEKDLLSSSQAKRKFRRVSSVQCYEYYAKLKCHNADLLSIGLDSSEDEDYSEDTELLRQCSPISDDEVEGSKDELLYHLRPAKLSLGRSRFRRQLQQLLVSHRSDAWVRKQRSNLTSLILNASRLCANTAAQVATEMKQPGYLKTEEDNKKKWDSSMGIKSRPCLHMDATNKPCETPALPMTNHCTEHIMYNVDQQLFDYCTAKFSDNTQCCIPVFDVRHELPLCTEHAAKADNYSKNVEPKPKKPRKKTKPSALTRPPKKGKKKKNQNKKSGKDRPASPMDQQNTSEIDVGESESFTADALIQAMEAGTIPAPQSTSASVASGDSQKSIKSNVSASSSSNERMAHTSSLSSLIEQHDIKDVSAVLDKSIDILPGDLPNTLSPGSIVESALDLPLGSEHDNILDEQDLHDVLNKLPDEEFDLFTGKNGEFDVTMEDTDALERALVEASKDEGLAHEAGFMDSAQDDELTKQIADSILNQSLGSPAGNSLADDDELDKAGDNLQDLASISTSDLKGMSQALNPTELQSALGFDHAMQNTTNGQTLPNVFSSTPMFTQPQAPLVRSESSGLMQPHSSIVQSVSSGLMQTPTSVVPQVSSGMLQTTQPHALQSVSAGLIQPQELTAPTPTSTSLVQQVNGFQSLASQQLLTRSMSCPAGNMSNTHVTPVTPPMSSHGNVSVIQAQLAQGPMNPPQALGQASLQLPTSLPPSITTLLSVGSNGNSNMDTTGPSAQAQIAHIQAILQSTAHQAGLNGVSSSTNLLNNQSLNGSLTESIPRPLQNAASLVTSAGSLPSTVPSTTPAGWGLSTGVQSRGLQLVGPPLTQGQNQQKIVQQQAIGPRSTPMKVAHPLHALIPSELTNLLAGQPLDPPNSPDVDKPQPASSQPLLRRRKSARNKQETGAK